ncbi:unnamed protein product [Caenorhabditis sp. 36 PRJEB53466]|nr:unnamed protein product [Caenorhabditis sp. 36 PRJEB53466]
MRGLPVSPATRFLIFSVLSFLALVHVFRQKVALPLLGEPDSMYMAWNRCMFDEMSQLSTLSEDAFWTGLEKPMQKCEVLMSRLTMIPFNNKDETKYSVLPLKSHTVSTIVSLGVGQDVNAELLLRQRLYSAQFFGADPIVEGNDALYSAFGTFFPFAVGNSSRMSNASVLLNGSYVDKPVIHVEFVYFLKKLVNRTYFDNIWMDAENAEYELFEYFYVGGELDRAGITVCQFNMEVHSPDGQKKKQFREFMTRIFSDEKYAFFRPVRASHFRLYFVNFKDPKCTNAYIGY